MLKHGRAGVPMEVMGLMLGEFIDEYTVQVIDVFAMPQSGTTVSVESVDHVFQTKMVDMLKQTGRRVELIQYKLPSSNNSSHFCRPEMVVGWYHSHPGFGCWLSSVDINTQQVRSARRSLHSRASSNISSPSHLAVFRISRPPFSRRRNRSHSIRQGQSRYRCLPIDQPSVPHLE
jgi:26S proteasome regulatory subunit N11